MSKATLAKVFGGVAALSIAAGQVISQQSVLPHDLNGWLHLAGAVGLYLAVHHSSGTDGSR